MCVFGPQKYVGHQRDGAGLVGPTCRWLRRLYVVVLSAKLELSRSLSRNVTSCDELKFPYAVSISISRVRPGFES